MITSWGVPLFVASGVWVALAVAVFAVFWGAIARAWRAPVLRRPVLVLESDDWGAGPLAQAQALRAIADTLAKHRDETGRHPVMSVALVLAVADGPGMGASRRYRRIELDAEMFEPVLGALRVGLGNGTFSVQLHGHEHFWPDALMACVGPLAAAWLRLPPPAASEKLPPHLQSRWVDASLLPSTALPAAQIRVAVGEEIGAYRRIVGEQPLAVVPPTFVWTREVERAWAAAGIEFVVTPGYRSTRRNSRGVPDGDEGPIVNGDRAGSLTYLVRTDYFEPIRGRDASHALRALGLASAQGQPCVLENHRDNFIFDEQQCRQSLTELDTLCASALRHHPNLRFLSTVDLGRIVRSRDALWVVEPWRQRLPFVWQRLRHSERLWRLMRLTGLAAIGAVLVERIGRPPAGMATGPLS